VEVDVYSADSFAVGSLRYFAAESFEPGCPSLNHDLSDGLAVGSTDAGFDIAVGGSFDYLDIVDNMCCCLSAVGVDSGSSLGLNFDIVGVGVEVGNWLDSWVDNWLGIGGAVGLGKNTVCHPNHHLNLRGRVGLQLEFHHQSAEMEGY